ncbi:MAG: glycosyltransferase [Gammaproteobacteria bacterium]
MKICLVITGLTMGGAERQVCDLADEFVALGHEVVLISLNQDPVVLPKSPDVRVIHLYMTKTPSGLLAGFLRLRKAVVGFRPDVVHAHMIHANILCRVLRILTPMPQLVCTAHNTNEGGKLREWLYRCTDRLATISTNVTQEAVDTYIDKRISYPGRMIAIPNGIDTSAFRFSPRHRSTLRDKLELDPNCFFFLSVGRLETQKDYANLIRAYSDLSKSETPQPHRLAIIGQGTLEHELKQSVKHYGLGNKVTFLGNQFNVNEWMSACDAYVLSSAWEGFGLVVAEAMLCERVVVATDCGGVKEVVGEHGILVPPKCSDALTAAMLRVMHLTAQSQAILGEKGRAHILNHYDLSQVAQTWIDTYARYRGP